MRKDEKFHWMRISEKEHEVSYILITNKSLRYKYSRYGIVVTRGKLREILSRLFLNAS